MLRSDGGASAHLAGEQICGINDASVMIHQQWETSPAPKTEAALMSVRMLISFHFEMNQESGCGRWAAPSGDVPVSAGEVNQKCSDASPPANAAVIPFMAEAVLHPFSGLDPRASCCPTHPKHQKSWTDFQTRDKTI